MIRVLFIVFILFLQIAGSHASSENDDLTLRKSYPIQVFMSTCVAGRGHADKVESQAIRIGFMEVPDNVARQYLGGNKGKVWYANNQHGRYALALLKNGLCSVFIYQGDPDRLQASMEAWLPPENGGFRYEKQVVSQAAELKTTLYLIYRDALLMEQWQITVSSQPTSELVAIMSYDAR